MIPNNVNFESKRVAQVHLPPVIFGTSGLGNLFVALDDNTKLEIVKEILRLSNGRVVFDSAGKYGAGLALETLGRCLQELKVSPEDVLISNKLGWVRTELKTQEPTFEPGVWKNLKYDAVQKISYDGILECFNQGNELLGAYHSKFVSVHDPDEYLSKATDSQQATFLYKDILDAYAALFSLKEQGKVTSVGVGAKDWKIIQRIAQDIELDWVMIANSLTIHSHPKELIDFVADLKQRGVQVINSAVFHSGFLVGSNYFNYKLLTPGTTEADALFGWRDKFYSICKSFGIEPAIACVQFALNIPGINSIALNTTNVKRVKENLAMVSEKIPEDFWHTMKKKGLISTDHENLYFTPVANV